MDLEDCDRKPEIHCPDDYGKPRCQRAHPSHVQAHAVLGENPDRQPRGLFRLLLHAQLCIPSGFESRGNTALENILLLLLGRRE